MPRDGGLRAGRRVTRVTVRLLPAGKQAVFLRQGVTNRPYTTATHQKDLVTPMVTSGNTCKFKSFVVLYIRFIFHIVSTPFL